MHNLKKYVNLTGNILIKYFLVKYFSLGVGEIEII